MALLFEYDPTVSLRLPALPGGKDTVHVFDDESIMAINAALAAGRPLLIKGEPGTGKSQLARAAAVALGRNFASLTLDARTEVGDLFWSLDSVKRLAEAQVVGALLGLRKSGEPEAAVTPESKSEADADEPKEPAGKRTPAELLRAQVRDELDERNFTRPGPLWWGFHWQSAEELLAKQGCQAPEQNWATSEGTVVLLDEIDKADISVPNGLLEALGSGRFAGPGSLGAIEQGDVQPLIIVTTNDEQTLPHAFLRRCLVIHFALPGDDDLELKKFLVARAQAHFAELDPDLTMLEEAADLLINDRKKCEKLRRSPPGQAEYLDLVRAVCALADSPEEQRQRVHQVAPFTFSKHSNPQAKAPEASP